MPQSKNVIHTLATQPKNSSLSADWGAILTFNLKRKCMNILQNVSPGATSIASFFGISDERASELSRNMTDVMVRENGKPATHIIMELDKISNNVNELVSVAFLLGSRFAEPERAIDSKYARLFKVADPNSKSLLGFLGISDQRAREITSQFLSVTKEKSAMEPQVLLMALDLICRRPEEMLFGMFIAMRTATGMLHFKTEPLKSQGDVKYKD